MCKSVRDKIRRLWTGGEVHGITLIFDTLLLIFRCVSVSYWLKDWILQVFLDSHGIGAERDRRVWRDNTIDVYCILQLAIVVLILCWNVVGFMGHVVVAYVIFEIYLNLFSIFFLPRQRKLGTPTEADVLSAVNEPSTAPERSILLLFVNALQVILAFAIFYRDSLGMTRSTAFLQAVLVFGTVGYPAASTLLIASQVLLDFVLVVVILASVIGQAGPFATGIRR